MIVRAIDVLELVAAEARAIAEHEAHCPYCLQDRVDAMMRQAMERAELVERQAATAIKRAA